MNPEILPVVNEISEVLKKHDMMGVVIVANKTHVDFRMDIETSWSCAKFESPDYVRIRCLAKDFPSKEAQKEVLTSTVGAIVTFTDVFRLLQENCNRLLVKISEYVEFIGRSTREQ